MNASLTEEKNLNVTLCLQENALQIENKELKSLLDRQSGKEMCEKQVQTESEENMDIKTDVNVSIID